MPIFDLYSKRKKAIERSGQPDVYQYESIPENVTNQIIMVLCDAIKNHEGIWSVIINTLAREYGDPSILIYFKQNTSMLDNKRSCLEFLKTQLHTDRKLDLIELSFRFIDRNKIGPHPEGAVSELNYRLREGGVG
jgi:hypothetical protein